MFSNAFSVPFTQPVMPLSWTVIRIGDSKQDGQFCRRHKLDFTHARLTTQTDRSSRAFLPSLPRKCGEPSNSNGAFIFPIDSIDRSIVFDGTRIAHERDAIAGGEFAHHKLRARPERHRHCYSDKKAGAARSRARAPGGQLADPSACRCRPRRPPPSSLQSDRPWQWRRRCRP